MANLKNLEIITEFSNDRLGVKSAIGIYNADTNISGNICVKTKGIGACFRLGNGTLDITPNSKVSIKTSGDFGYGFYILDSAIVNIASNSLIDINTSGTNSYGLNISNNSICNIASKANVNIRTENCHGIFASSSNLDINQGANLSIYNSVSGFVFGIYLTSNAKANIAGNLQIEGKPSSIIALHDVSQLYISSMAQLYTSNSSILLSRQNYGSGANVLTISQGAKIAVEKDGKTKWYEVKDDYNDENTTTTDNVINASNIETVLDVAATSAWTLPSANEATDEEESSVQANVEAYQNQFNTALKEYDKLINDCGYQGINLLKGGNLKLTFDENRQHIFNISGRDISSAQLGLNEALWQTQGDIEEAINQLNTSITTLRSLAENLGNQYSIITTRINFTEALTDILETGADDLTLADMNEASAQYLSLQTRQQLAINSLSLASLSAKSILSLFY